MSQAIRRVDYFHTTVPDRPGEAYRVLSAFQDRGIGLLAFAATPVGPARTQLTVIPDDAGRFGKEAADAGLTLDGPHGAILVQGTDVPGALVEVHERLYQADVNVYAATGVASGDGRYGYVLYLRPEALSRAVDVLGI